MSILKIFKNSYGFCYNRIDFVILRSHLRDLKISLIDFCLKESKAGVYIVNVTPKGKALDSNDLKQILTAAADGSAVSL